MNRRAFLRRAGGAALALPLLQLPGRARAQEVAGYPTRLVIFHTTNGSRKELWSPYQAFGHTAERGFELGPILRPLAPFRDQLVLMDGIDLAVTREGPGGPHQRGMACGLTGAVITEGDFVDGDGRRAGWAGGISIDQLVAKMLRPGTRLSTLELGVRVVENEVRSRISYGGAEQPIPPENDPVAAFDRAFGRMGDNPEAMRRLLLRRRSVLDSVMGDFTDLRGRLARVDVEKLERHADALRDLERRLAVVAERPELCNGTSPDIEADLMAEDAFPRILTSQRDVLVNALACDVTRIATFQCSSAVNALTFPHLGVGDHQGHSLSHMGDSSEQARSWDRVLTWYSEQFAGLLAGLAAVPEGDGTLLDHTVVFWLNELSRGNTHSHDDMPFLLAGGGRVPGIDGPLRTGRFLRYQGASHNDLLVSIGRLMGLPITTFGDPRFCTGPLVGL